MAKANLPTDDEIAEAAIAAAFRRQIRFWLITAVVLGIFVYLFSEILLPFVAGMVLAYFLDPVADWLERTGLSRTAATFLILFCLRRRADDRAGDPDPDPRLAARRLHRQRCRTI